MPACRICQQDFVITNEDMEFYADQGPKVHGRRVGVPPPTLCMQCRIRRKLAFRNERRLYRRRCDQSGKELFSIYSPDKPYTVYENGVWYGDSWDARTFGRAYDPARSFFEQFSDLLRAVPRPARITFGVSENSDYCNHHLSCKDCYLFFWGDNSERSVLCYGCGRLRNCLDCKASENCTSCAHTLDCMHCNDCAYIEDCERVSESRYMLNCRDCRNCFQCVNLRHKQYCIRNTPYPSKAAYESELAKYPWQSFAEQTRQQAEFQSFAAAFPRRALHLLRVEDCRGDHIGSGKDCRECYWLIGDQNERCRYTVASGEKTFRLYDMYGSGYNLVSCYESFGLANGVQDCGFCLYVTDGVRDTYYSADCRSSHDLFGCVGLNHAEYCILNVKYSPAEYEALSSKIIEDMRARKEWGEFFPLSVSPFGYNESAAADHYPLLEAEACALGAHWSDYERSQPQVVGAASTETLPDSLELTTDDILGQTLLCCESSLPFRISRLELQLCRDLRVPLPRLHPDVRLHRLARAFGPFRLWRSTCSQCGRTTDSGVDPKVCARVLCERCFEGG